MTIDTAADEQLEQNEDDDRKRIVYVAPHSPSAVGYDSQEDFLEMAHYHQKYCQLMIEAGYEVYFLHFGEEYRQFTHEYGHEVRQLPVSVGNDFNTEVSIRLPFEIFRLDPDILHVHGNPPKILFGLPLTWFINAKLVVQNHGASLDPSKWRVQLLYTFFRLLLFPTNCTILSVNREEMENLKNAKVAQQIKYIPNAVDTEFYNCEDTDAARVAVDLPTDRSYLVYVGRIDESKGVDYLIKAFDALADRYPDLEILLVYGAYEDDVLEQIKTVCNDLGRMDRVRFVGRVPEADLPHYYNASDVAVFPSVNEGFGVVTLEAMSCGVPVVGTTAHTEGNQRHLVDGKNALIAAAGSSGDLTERIDTLLSDRDLASEIADRGYRHVREHHTWEVIMKRLQRVYDEN